MKNFNIAIIDDNDLCINVLRNSLLKFPNIQIISEAQTPDTGERLIMEQHPDLLFLDVEMPNISGLELLHEISDKISWPMQVVFYTAHDKYLLEALRVSAFDYLLKPFKMAELEKVMNRFFVYTRKEKTNTPFQSSLTQLLPVSSVFMIATINGFQVLRLEQIGYFSYQKEPKQWTVILSDQSQLLLKRNTCAKDILKYAPSFIQINQHQIINIDYLAMIHDKLCVLYPPFNSQEDLYISRNFLRELQDRFSMI